jgi:hypothetical protein
MARMERRGCQARMVRMASRASQARTDCRGTMARQGRRYSSGPLQHTPLAWPTARNVHPTRPTNDRHGMQSTVSTGAKRSRVRCGAGCEVLMYCHWPLVGDEMRYPAVHISGKGTDTRDMGTDTCRTLPRPTSYARLARPCAG